MVSALASHARGSRFDPCSGTEGEKFSGSEHVPSASLAAMMSLQIGTLTTGPPCAERDIICAV